MLERCKLRREVAHHGWFLHDPEAADVVLAFGEFLEHFDDIVRMRLGVDPARHGKADKVHPGRFLAAIRLAAKHDRADLAAPDAAFLIQRAGQRVPRIFQWRNVRKPFAGIDEYGMPKSSSKVPNERHDTSPAFLATRTIIIFGFGTLCLTIPTCEDVVADMKFPPPAV